MMERTPEREAFFAEVRRDPYTAALTHMVADAWAAGYEQALRDLTARHEHDERARHVGLAADDLRYEKSWSDRRDDYLAWLTGERRRKEAELVIAMAQLGANLASPLGGSVHARDKRAGESA